MRTSPMTLKALALLTLTTGFTACDDTQRQVSKPATTPAPAPSIVAEKAKDPEVPVSPPAKVALPSNPITPDLKKEETKDDESASATATDLLSRTRNALASGETDRALKLAARAVQKAPKRSSAWNLLGRAQLQGGKRKLALDSFEKAVELNPKNSYAQNNLGLTLIYQQRYADAIESLEAATEIEPVEGFMWNNLGMAYEHADRLDDARDAYGKAAEMDNDNARGSLARLQGVKTVIRTAKVDSESKTGKKTEKTTDDAIGTTTDKAADKTTTSD